MIRLCAFSDEAASDLKGQIEALHRNGLTYTELRSVGGKNVKDFSVAEAKEYANILKREGIAVWAIASPLGKEEIGLDFSAYLNTVKHVAELAGIFGTGKIRAFSFYRAYGERDRVVEYLCRMSEAVREAGAALYHENEKGIYGDTAERVLDLLDSVPGLRSVYDPANFLQVGEKAECTLPLLHGKSDYFHIKDVVCGTGEVVPAGEGDGDIPRLIGMIERPTVLSVEPHLRIFDGYSAIDKTALRGKYVYPDSGTAFDAAVSALRALVGRCAA